MSPRLRTLPLAFVLGAASMSTLSSCGGASSHPTAERPGVREPSWADLFDGPPDTYAVLRPRAMKRDALYGNFFRAIVRAAIARNVVQGDTMVDALEGADEVIVAINRGHDAALVVRGVSSSLDPQRLLGVDGKPLFGLVSDRARIAEYDLLLGERPGVGRLFVLPDRTWIFALGAAHARARTAFASPAGRPKPELAPDALLAVRVSGAMTTLLRGRGRLEALSRKLTSATVVLKPGEGGVVASLVYDDVDAAAWSEMEANRLLADLAKDPGQAWLRDAEVAYQGRTLSVRVAVPPRLLEELPKASSADLWSVSSGSAL